MKQNVERQTKKGGGTEAQVAAKRLNAVYARLRAQGVVDVKPALGPGVEKLSLADVYNTVAAALEAIEAGRVTEIKGPVIGDSYGPLKPSRLSRRVGPLKD